MLNGTLCAHDQDCRAVLTLLPKKGDLTDIKCWRPVSVLCCDYKILAKALANRLAGVLEQVIQSDQTYCIPGRSMFDNISLGMHRNENSWPKPKPNKMKHWGRITNTVVKIISPPCRPILPFFSQLHK